MMVRGGWRCGLNRRGEEMYGICWITSCGEKGLEIFWSGGLGGFSWRRREEKGLAWALRELRGRGEERDA